MRRILLPALLGTALGALGTLPSHAGQPEVGQLHPELRLPTLDGERTVSVRGLRGAKVLLIEFASW